MPLRRNRLPNLTGAYLAGIEHSPGTLALRVVGVRRGLWLSDGEVVFEGIWSMRIHADRPGEADVALRPGATLYHQRSDAPWVLLVLERQSGPGDLERVTLRIGATNVSARLRPSPGRSLRKLIGFYPLPRDHRYG